MTARLRTDCEGFHRRDLLKIGSAGLLGLSLPELLRLEARAADGARKTRATSVIMIWLSGGPSHLDMWDLKPDAPEGIRGEFKPIETRAKGVQISEHLPLMAGVADKVSLVRSLNHSVPAHGPGAVFMTTGNAPSPALQYPALGSLAARMLPVEREVPPYLVFGDSGKSGGNSSGYLGSAYNPFIVEGVATGKARVGGAVATASVRGITLPTGFTLEELENRAKLMKGFDQGLRALDQSPTLGAGLDAFHTKALEILRSPKTKSAFDLSQEKEATRERFGLNGFGQGVLLSRRLVEAGVRFVTISLGGWDTHAKNFESLSKNLLPQLDQALSSLVDDLDSRGMLDSTIVYCAGEFGRTPKVNSGAGRDHWARSMAVMLAGGGIKRGYVHGSTDAHGMAPVKDACSPDDVAATVFQSLGVDPHQELRTSTGRPIVLFREGKVIEKLLA